MTIAKLSAGDGYTYYISEIATGDHEREPGQLVADYYLAHGNPPGVWMGSGTRHLEVSGRVSTEQMKALYGEGLHPDAERLIAEALARGASPKEAAREAKLGRAFYRYGQREATLPGRTNEELARFERLNHRAPDAEERRVIRARVAGEVFRDQHGRDARSGEELARFVSAASKPGQQAVAGYDLQFAPAKTVSVLWALGDEDTRREIEQAHEVAIEQTLNYIEKEATATRAGVNGIAQLDVDGGLVATRFRHYDSRNGDPQLHDHVVVANKVKGVDGKWRSLDGQLLYRLGVSASEHYNQVVIEEVTRRLGVVAEQREVTPGKRPVVEIAGVDTRLAAAYSSRSQDVKERASQLAADYFAAHGKAPDTITRIKLAQQATLETRPSKSSARSLGELRETWRAAAVQLVGERGVDDMLSRAREAAQRVRPAQPLDVETAAREVLATVEEHRSVWGRHHLEAEARRVLVAHHHGRTSEEHLVAVVTERAVTAGSVSITPPSFHDAFAPLTRADGSSIYERRASQLFTSRAILAAEDRLLSAARTAVVPAVSAETFQRVVDAAPRRLDRGQLALARAFATSDQLLVAGIGPAGTGKTTSLSLVTEAVQAQGGRVIGLAPSARAAQVMSTELGTTAHTLHAWLGARERGAQKGRIPEAYALRRGDVVIVDEAGMAGTRRLAQVLAEVEAVGAHLRLIGDPGQLAAVESGGALRLIAAEVGAVELESVWRFKDPAEAAASLRLRDGADPSRGEGGGAFDWYLEQHRVVGGDRDAMLDATFGAWQRDVAAGRSSMMMAGDNATVAALNGLAQAYVITEGRVDPTRTTDLRDGLAVGVGDLVVTRTNDRTNRVLGGRDFVKNGDVWAVEKLHGDGSMDVVHTTHQGRARFSPDYVAASVELGYAATFHRAQGVTVDTAHSFVDASTSLEAAYVGLTRGRAGNYAHVVVETGQSSRDVLEQIAGNRTASVSAHESIRTEQARVEDLERLVDEHADVAEHADRQRLQWIVRGALGEAAEPLLAAEGWPGMARSLRDAETAGWSAERIVVRAYNLREFSTADDDAAVMSWRIDRLLEESAADVETATTQRPLASLSAEQLRHLAQVAQRQQRHAYTEQRAERSRDEPRPVRAGQQLHPAWTRRPHGDLLPAELHAAIATARTITRAGSPDVASLRVAHTDLAGLRAENALRKQMDRASYTREADQRGRHRNPDQTRPRPSGAPEPTVTATIPAPSVEPVGPERSAASAPASATREVARDSSRLRDSAADRARRAEVIAARIGAEQRLRERLPDHPEVPPAPDELPEWMAAARAVSDPATPAAWREHLGERRAHLIDRLRETGEQLAVDKPVWTQDLGPVPASGPARERWLMLAASIELYRRQRKIGDVVALPARENDPVHTELREQLTQHTTRRATEQKRSRQMAEIDRIRQQIQQGRPTPEQQPSAPAHSENSARREREVAERTRRERDDRTRDRDRDRER